MAKLFLLGLSLFSSSVFAFNMAYVEVNSNRLDNVRCYLRTDNNQPYFSITAIFAGNINGNDPNNPKIYFNDNVVALLKTSQVQDLQAQGIKVLMTLLGNHENTGWSCMTNEDAAKRFANDIVAMVNQYHLDGIDIDDEYSQCSANNYSMIMLAQAIKTHPDFKGKLLTKALFADAAYFRANYKGHKLAEFLDYGWEMSYYSGDFKYRLAEYLANGMSASQLMLGGWTQLSHPDPFLIGQFTAENTLAGVMIYDITTASQNYLDQLLSGETDKQANVYVQNACLQ